MVGGEFRALEEAGVDRVLRRALHLASPQEPSVAEGDWDFVYLLSRIRA